jgi:hypothetical protein
VRFMSAYSCLSNARTVVNEMRIFIRDMKSAETLAECLEMLLDSSRVSSARFLWIYITNSRTVPTV